MNHQQINSDALEGSIRNPIQQEEVVGRALSGSVCSLPLVSSGLERDPVASLPVCNISPSTNIKVDGNRKVRNRRRINMDNYDVNWFPKRIFNCDGIFFRFPD